MAHKPVRLFCCDLNWIYREIPSPGPSPSAPPDWAWIDPAEYFRWHIEFGNNAVFCQAYTFGGYALYPTRFGPLAPGPGQELLPRLFDLARAANLPFWSYFCVGADLILSSLRNPWIIPGSRECAHHGFLAPESPWTDLLCARIREFLEAYPADWLLFDWFVYGNLKPDTAQVRPAWFVKQPFHEILGREMPEQASDITPDEHMRYKREILARQFRRIRDTVRAASPKTRIAFNVPYWEPRETIWIDHPMLHESDGLFAECSREDVVDWLLEIRKPNQRVMTTIIGRLDEGQCDPGSWRRWHERGCDFFGYAFGSPPDFRPHPFYRRELDIVRQAFRELGR
jgi:hypothetical protein